MAITAQLVKELRARTDAPMMKCKQALTEADGDIDLAEEKLRIASQSSAAKKSARTTAEGVVRIAQNGAEAALVEINSETDFVARDENFLAFAEQVAAAALASKAQDIETLSGQAMPGGEGTVEEARLALVAKIGENIHVRRVEYIASGGTLGVYCHGDRIGVMVALTSGQEDLARDVAMHIAAANPAVIHPEDVPADMVEKEREIFRAQAAESGKPAEIIEKMIEGRLRKFFNEVSLMGQAFVKEPDTSVGKLLKGANAEVEKFFRFEVGEGIEKKVDNFADEVMAQVRGDE